MWRPTQTYLPILNIQHILFLACSAMGSLFSDQWTSSQPWKYAKLTSVGFLHIITNNISRGKTALGSQLTLFSLPQHYLRSHFSKRQIDLLPIWDTVIRDGESERHVGGSCSICHPSYILNLLAWRSRRAEDGEISVGVKSPTITSCLESASRDASLGFTSRSAVLKNVVETGEVLVIENH